MMKYISTRGGGQPLNFTEAVLAGLARDGGLYLPETLPDFSASNEAFSKLSYKELAFEIMRPFADTITEEELRGIVEKSYSTFRDSEVTPVRQVGPVSILELFHGPTLAFKDVALQFLGNLFECILAKTGGEMNIVAATSGDTGSAAINGVRGRKGIRIFVMHPAGRVSPVQEMQMTTVTDDNVFNLAVKGTFDDCQNIVKELFGDLQFRDANKLGAVNSINWARLLAQVVYYFYAAYRVIERTGAKSVDFSVPTGNFGDIFAGYIARRLGAPVRRLVLATNENDILSRYLDTGTYSVGEVVPTLSPSMDIQVASNFERYLYYLSGCNPEKVSSWMRQFRETGSLTPDAAAEECFVSGRGDTADTLRTIAQFHREYGYLLDPHTAVGVAAALRRIDEGVPMVCLSTAHPAKFPDAIIRATGEDIARHPLVDALAGKPVRKFEMPADRKAVGDFVSEKCNAPR